MSSKSIRSPQPFLEVIVHDSSATPVLLGVCAGFEKKKWRSSQLSKHLCEWLPEFALDPSELTDIEAGKLVPIIRKAAQAIYTTKKFKRRGEIGELLLHVIARQVYKTQPVISKLYYKDSSNDTVKGFDSVHVVENGEELELWLGEAKFYESLGSATKAVVKDLKSHSEANYLRGEFCAITNKLSKELPFYSKLEKLLHPNTSLDVVFSKLIVPVLLTYDSDVLAVHKESSQAYKDAIISELKQGYSDFCKLMGNLPLVVHLFLFPLQSKKELADTFDAQLKVWQAI